MRRDRKISRTGEEKLNNQGCLMKIIEYINCRNIIVQFQDEYKARVHTNYDSYIKGNVRNPFAKTVSGVGIIGDKYAACINRKGTKEYNVWSHMLKRCFDEKYKKRNPTYKNVTCCDEWLYYPNFYEWLHSQSNFDNWYNGNNWNLDKDIIIKNNKVYSPDTCCLVPCNVNSLFTKRDNDRGDLPVGVTYNKVSKKYRAQCNNPFTGKRVCVDICQTSEEAFLAYKIYKEDIIKQIAQQEFNNGNITEKCYNAMMRYEVEITD